MILSANASHRQAICVEADSLTRISRDYLTSFRVELGMVDGSTRIVNVDASDLVNYAAFRRAVLARADIIFGAPCFERRGGASEWREETAAALRRGQEATRKCD